MRVDAHHHFWQYNAKEYGWIDDEMSILKKDYLFDDLVTHLRAHQLDGVITVQARQSTEETDWLLDIANKNTQVFGVVGWTDLRSKHLEKDLERWSGSQKLKGFRHVIQDEPDPHFMRNEDFLSGIKLIQKHGYHYEILVTAEQLPEVIRMLDRLPEMPLVLNHIGKPDICSKERASWAQNIKTLATHKHLYCKVSGMVTEADWKDWKPGDFQFYLDQVFNHFSAQRLMYGSDWPVCNLAGQYSDVIGLVENYINHSYPADLHKVMGDNAELFYKI